MHRLRRSFDEMSPAQRGTLAVLTALVVVAAAVAIVAVAAGDGGANSAEGTTVTTVPAGSQTTTVTSPPDTSTTVASTSSTSTSMSTTSTSSTTSTTTTSRPPSGPEVLLRPDGIGTQYFGEEAAAVLGELSATFGDPDEDTGWVDQRENYGICLGETVRFVRWGSLQVFFTDGPSDWQPAGVRHFASYNHSGLFDGEVWDLETADGLALGSPVGDVRALYGEGSVFDDGLYGPVFVHDPPGAAYLWGSVSGLAPDDVIVSIVGSYACGE